MAKKLVIISIDAMGASDLVGDLTHIPFLNELKASGTHVQNIQPIYPSLTYPSHTTIVTGEYPNTHGIINNTKIQPQRKSPDWYWYRKDVLAPTLYDVAKEAGLTTAAFLWPVTAKSSINWNIAEIFPNRIWTNQVLTSLSASSPRFLLDMNHKYGHLRKGIQQPYLDDFITACAVDTLIHKQPDLTLIHLVDLDSARHKHGVLSTAAKEALRRQDSRVKSIVEATKEAGTYQDTTFVILGDHYQIDVNQMVRLNSLFAQKGWLRVTRENTVHTSWDVYAKSCDGSCYIYIDENSLVQPREILRELEKIDGIAEIYTTDQAAVQGAADNVTFMLEARRGYYFVDEPVGAITEIVKGAEIGQPDRYRAVHGFSPKKLNYSTTLMVKGPGIRQGKVIEKAELIDEAPTFAAILGLERFPATVAGNVLSEIFEKWGGEVPSEILE